MGVPQRIQLVDFINPGFVYYGFAGMLLDEPSKYYSSGPLQTVSWGFRLSKQLHQYSWNLFTRNQWTSICFSWFIMIFRNFTRTQKYVKSTYKVHTKYVFCTYPKVYPVRGAYIPVQRAYFSVPKHVKSTYFQGFSASPKIEQFHDIFDHLLGGINHLLLTMQLIHVFCIFFQLQPYTLVPTSPESPMILVRLLVQSQLGPPLQWALWAGLQCLPKQQSLLLKFIVVPNLKRATKP